MRLYERLTAGALIALAFVAIRDSFPKAGWGASGPGAGFYPLWSAVMMSRAAAFILLPALRMPAGGRLFASSAGAGALAKLVVPMVVAVALIGWLGLYIVSGAYMALFARWVGRYRWLSVVVIGVGVPLALYLGFERGFRVPLPKSIFYGERLSDYLGVDIPLQLPF